MATLQSHKTNACSVAFEQRDVSLETGGHFYLRFSGDLREAAVFLTIDVYDLGNGAHPTGHVGWWRFPVEPMGERISGRLSQTSQGIDVSIANVTSEDGWLNESPPRTNRYTVNAVLRTKSTNAVVALDRVPAFANAKQVAEFRSPFSRDWLVPRFASPSHMLPLQMTVRIVSRTIRLRDAVGTLCLDLYRMLRQNNVSVEAYAEEFNLELNDVVRPIERLVSDARKEDCILYFYSIYDEHLDLILSLDVAQKIAYFHGVTPPNMVRVFDPKLSELCERSFGQLSQLARFDTIAANSLATAHDLVRHIGSLDLSIEKIRVITPCLIPERNSVKKMQRDGSSRPSMLFVGRLSPHKRVEHLLMLFAAYQRLCPDAECWIAGPQPNATYRAFLGWMEKSRLAVPSGRVQWLGEVSESRLDTLYRMASVYISMSEHEGFCLPVLEAMSKGLPVFAYAEAAVEEVLGGTGVLFHEKDFFRLAKNLQTLLDAEGRLGEIIRLQCVRAEVLMMGANGSRFWDLFK